MECQVPNCSLNQRIDNGIGIQYFPKCRTTARKWCEAINRIELMDISRKNLLKLYVCGKHFIETQVNKRTRKVRYLELPLIDVEAFIAPVSIKIEAVDGANDVIKIEPLETVDDSKIQEADYSDYSMFPPIEEWYLVPKCEMTVDQDGEINTDSPDSVKVTLNLDGTDYSWLEMKKKSIPESEIIVLEDFEFETELPDNFNESVQTKGLDGTDNTGLIIKKERILESESEKIHVNDAIIKLDPPHIVDESVVPLTGNLYGTEILTKEELILEPEVEMIIDDDMVIETEPPQLVLEPTAEVVVDTEPLDTSNELIVEPEADMIIDDDVVIETEPLELVLECESEMIVETEPLDTSHEIVVLQAGNSDGTGFKTKEELILESEAEMINDDDIAIGTEPPELLLQSKSEVIAIETVLLDASHELVVEPEAEMIIDDEIAIGTEPPELILQSKSEVIAIETVPLDASHELVVESEAEMIIEENIERIIDTETLDTSHKLVVESEAERIIDDNMVIETEPLDASHELVVPQTGSLDKTWFKIKEELIWESEAEIIIDDDMVIETEPPQHILEPAAEVIVDTEPLNTSHELVVESEAKRIIDDDAVIETMPPEPILEPADESIIDDDVVMETEPLDTFHELVVKFESERIIDGDVVMEEVPPNTDYIGFKIKEELILESDCEMIINMVIETESTDLILEPESAMIIDDDVAILTEPHNTDYSGIKIKEELILQSESEMMIIDDDVFIETKSPNTFKDLKFLQTKNLQRTDFTALQIKKELILESEVADDVLVKTETTDTENKSVFPQTINLEASGYSQFLLNEWFLMPKFEIKKEPESESDFDMNFNEVLDYYNSNSTERLPSPVPDLSKKTDVPNTNPKEDKVDGNFINQVIRQVEALNELTKNNEVRYWKY
ncbi:unnamed protein product [Diamesa hyperborea]